VVTTSDGDDGRRRRCGGNGLRRRWSLWRRWRRALTHRRIVWIVYFIISNLPRPPARRIVCPQPV